MVEPVKYAARRSLRLCPPGMGHRNPPWRFGGTAADLAPCAFGQKCREHKTPAVTFRVGDIAGGADEIAELQIAHRETGDGKLADRNLSRRAFAVFGKSPVVRSHHEGAADRRTPAARDRV